ncbi:hypothetical protein BDQ17DRAFT_1376398 [Cyathus striatus]|nr:hypothetical protein BDQ17DRAFT_1376398 [Cyathus striatus]
MPHRLLVPFLFILYLLASSKALGIPTYPSTPLPLSVLLNNKASIDFDGNGGRYDGRFLPCAPRLVYDGITVCVIANNGDWIINGVSMIYLTMARTIMLSPTDKFWF